MLGLKKIIVRINTILVLVILGLLLLISLSFYLYSTHSNKFTKGHEYAAELLAYGLYNDAVNNLYQIISQNPLSETSIKLRKIIIEILIEKLGDYEKALSELILLKLQEPVKLASFTEDRIRICLERLGRSYDAQRRIMLSEGINPLISTISSETIVAFGNQNIISIENVKQKLSQLGLPTQNPPKDTLNKIIQSLITEEVLKRAAERSGIRRNQSFIKTIKEIEDNLVLQMYLEKYVLQDIKVEDDLVDMYIKQNKHEFESPLRVIISILEFKDQSLALNYISGNYLATHSEIIVNKSNFTVDELPVELKSINWSNNPPNFLGPIQKDSKWYVYHIHEIIPPKKIPPELARQKAKIKLLEQKQSSKIAEKLTELIQKEDVKILHENIIKNFYTNNSENNK